MLTAIIAEIQAAAYDAVVPVDCDRRTVYDATAFDLSHPKEIIDPEGKDDV